MIWSIAEPDAYVRWRVSVFLVFWEGEADGNVVSVPSISGYCSGQRETTLWLKTHRNTVTESLEWKLIGHQSGSDLCALCDTVDCGGLLSGQLHRRLEGGHPSLCILAVLINLSEANNASDTCCSLCSLFLILVTVWKVHL